MSKECIDFTMMCFFLFLFFYVIKFWGSKNALIFNFSTYIDQKVNLVGTLEGQIPNNGLNNWDKQNKS